MSRKELAYFSSRRSWLDWGRGLLRLALEAAISKTRNEAIEVLLVPLIDLASCSKNANMGRHGPIPACPSSAGKQAGVTQNVVRIGHGMVHDRHEVRFFYNLHKRSFVV